MSSPELQFRPRPLSHRTWIRLGVIAAVVAVLYAFVAYAYDAQGSLEFSTDASADASDGVTVTVEPVEMNAVTNQANLLLTFRVTDAGIYDGTRLTENLRIDVQSGAGDQEIRFPVGTVLSNATTTLLLDGELAYYPFDSHTGDLIVSADTYTKGADGTLQSAGEVYVLMDARGGVSGWSTAVDVTVKPGGAQATIVFNRAFSTQIFALLLLLLAVTLAVATLVVGFLVASQRRRAEIGLMSWTAALLFALPALRTFMPNAPPIGAAIDIYVYLWVMAGAIAAAVIMIVSWSRQSGRMLLEDQTASAGGVATIPDAPSADPSGS